MPPPGESPLLPGPRTLFPLDVGAVIPADIVELLRMLGQASNEAGLAVLSAQTELAHAAAPLWRASEREAQDATMLEWVAGERYFACRDHLERLTAIYTRAAAHYATCALEVASQVADGRTARTPTPLSSRPSDLLTLAQIHVPLLQIPETAVMEGRRHLLVRINTELAQVHKLLVTAMAGVESPAATFDEPESVAQRQTGYLLEAEFPSALHEYASACAFSVTIMSAPK